MSSEICAGTPAWYSLALTFWVWGPEGPRSVSPLNLGPPASRVLQVLGSQRPAPGWPLRKQNLLVAMALPCLPRESEPFPPPGHVDQVWWEIKLFKEEGWGRGHTSRGGAEGQAAEKVLGALSSLSSPALPNATASTGQPEKHTYFSSW